MDILKDVLYRSKPITLSAVRKEIGNAYTANPLDNLVSFGQAVVSLTNRNLEANGHYFEHVL